ncbi:Fic family protein [Acetobacterium carbinolicum]|uniref:Fic family protein n=1 Tax=Acetobacterium carbinolicum TaxID=52690 RepID=UPI0039C9CCF8
MAIKGVSKLPVSVSESDAIKIFEILAETNLKMGQIKTKFDCSIVSNPLVQVLTLSESVQSTRIEGTQVTFSDMIEEKNKKHSRWEIIEVTNYQTALNQGADRISQGYPISTRLIKELHKILMDRGRGTAQASGEFRKIQNFIGPTNRIEDAVYLPVEANKIDSYMENLEFFINGEKHSSFENKTKDNTFVFDYKAQPLIKTAIMHAQFESIHPFLDGNGRLGRILVALNLIKEDLISEPIFLVSEELEKEKSRYYDLLNGVRGDNPDWAPWIIFFLNACKRMSENLLKKLGEVDKLAREGLSKCNTKTEEEVWIFSFSEPVTTAPEVAKKVGISANTARKALGSLSEAGLIYADKYAKRNKRYRNYDLVRILRD